MTELPKLPSTNIYLTSLELEDYGELEDRILYAIYYGPCGLRCKDPSAVEIDSQVEVQCPERVVRKDEQPMDLDLIINDIQNKLCFRCRMVGRGLDVQKWLAKTGIEFHWPGYQYMGPGTHLEKRLKRGDPGINRLDRIAKQHDIDYSRARNIQDKWKADDKMIGAIQALPGKKTWTEALVKKIMQAKRKLKL